MQLGALVGIEGARQAHGCSQVNLRGQVLHFKSLLPFWPVERPWLWLTLCLGIELIVYHLELPLIQKDQLLVCEY